MTRRLYYHPESYSYFEAYEPEGSHELLEVTGEFLHEFRFKRTTATHAEITQQEIRNRILVSVWAFAYEMMDDSMVDDAAYDLLALKVDVNMRTSYRGKDNRRLDKFFREQFAPDTGMWVRSHPELKKLKALYERMKNMSYKKETWRL